MPGMTLEQRRVANNAGKAHQAAAYSEWLAAEIHEAIDDPRPIPSHDEVMAEMEADIAALAKPARRAHEESGIAAAPIRTTRLVSDYVALTRPAKLACDMQAKPVNPLSIYLGVYSIRPFSICI